METVEESIISLLLQEPRKKFTIEYIAQKIKSKKAKHSRASIFRYCNKLLEQNILTSGDIGRVKQISLNFGNDEAIALISHIEAANKNNFCRQSSPALQDYFKRLESDFKHIHEIYSIIVFGSYAKGRQRAESDIDMIFLIETPCAIHSDEHIKAAIKKTKDIINAAIADLDAYLGNIKLSPIIIELEDYINGIKENKINVVTESFKEHIIIKNPFGYWEAIAGGLV